jgi:hypothetical protein
VSIDGFRIVSNIFLCANMQQAFQTICKQRAYRCNSLTLGSFCKPFHQSSPWRQIFPLILQHTAQLTSPQVDKYETKYAGNCPCYYASAPCTSMKMFTFLPTSFSETDHTLHYKHCYPLYPVPLEWAAFWFGFPYGQTILKFTMVSFCLFSNRHR